MSRTLLLVEDDDDIRQDLAFLIELRGYEVRTAANGREALDQLRLEPLPSMIVLDLMMPVMDGWETYAELKKDARLEGIPVLLLSGVADLAAKARSLDVVGYLTKPIDFDYLFEVLATHCVAES